ncbi:MAG: hypothetical protein R2873_30315 [Caldilineaceae bacterium]
MLVSAWNINASPDPFGPPAGNRMLAAWASVGRCPLRPAPSLLPGNALVLRQPQLAARRHTGRHVQTQGAMLARRRGDGNRAVMQTGGLRAERGHVGRAAHNRHADHVGLGGHLGVVGHRALVGDVAQHSPADPHVARLFHHAAHGGDRRYRPHSFVCIQVEDGGRLLDRADVGAGVHLSFFEHFQIPGQPQHAVGINAAQVGPDQHIGLHRRVFGGHPRR